MPAIETEGLTKIYRRSAPGILDLNLQLEQGEVAALLGPNGCGKTTTIRLLLDLLRPTRGRARVLGLDIRRGSLEIRRRCGYLPGDLVFHRGLTGLETLELYRRLRPGGAAPLREALLAAVGLDRSVLDRPVRDYSTGMRRKLGLVVALQHDPELGILDEPTTGLDPLVRRSCHDAIRAWLTRGRTLLLSSHDLLEVDALCRRVLVIRAHRLVHSASLAELRARAGGLHALEQALLDWFTGPRA